MIRVTAEGGSCHMGKIEYAKELIDVAADNGCWAIKFQLFKNKPPNIELPREWWGELKEYCNNRILLYASVFDYSAVKLLIEHNAPYIKYAYGQQRFNGAFGKLREIISCSPSDSFKYSRAIKLFCVPEYPVIYKIDFTHIFEKFPFDGFSDHTLGYDQTIEAVKYGAKMIEKHITLDKPDINCLDAYFALKPKELKEMMEEINEIQAN